MESKSKIRRAVLTGALGIVWLAAVVAAMKAQMDRERVPGPEGVPAPLWPQESILTEPSTLPVLILAIHPKCPCTRATLEELAVLHTELRGRLRSYLLFARPEGCSDEWTKSEYWSLALSIPGVVPIVDPEGKEAARFGALTSGHAFVYIPGGRRIFSGGITRARGETGPNAGRSSISALVTGTGSSVKTTSVFGCALRAP